MAENTRMEFTLTYPGPLDQVAADKQRDIRHSEGLAAEQELMDAPDVPGRSGEQTKPNPMVEGVTAAFKAVGSGAQSTMEGLTELLLPQATEEVAKKTPAEFLDSKVKALRKTLIDGLVTIGASPFVGLGTAAGQELKNSWPELANTQAFDSSAAFTIRHILSGAPDLNTLKPEEIQAMRQPMDVSEVLDLTVQSTPMALGGIRKVTQATKIQAPRIMGQQGGINLDRVRASENVKSIMNDINESVSTELQAHREVRGEGQVIEKSKQYAKNLEEWLAMTPEEIMLQAPEGLALRDVYNKAATSLDGLKKKAEAGDRDAQSKLLPMLLIVGQLDELREANGRNVARSLQAHNIPSEAERIPNLKDLLDKLKKKSATPVTQGTEKAREAIKAVIENPDPNDAEAAVKQIVADISDPEVVGELTKETARLIERAEQHRAKAEDAIAAIVAEANFKGEPKAPHAPTIAALVRGKMKSEMFAEEMKQRGTPISRASLRAVMDVVKKANADIEDQLARDRDAVVATFANAMIASGAEKPQKPMSMADAVASNIERQLFALGGDGLQAETVMALLKELDKRQAGSWAKQIYNGARAGYNVFVKAWIHSLLTSTITHTGNILGSAIGVLADIPERYGAEWLNAIRNNVPDGPQMGETTRSLMALGRAHEDMIRLVGKAWRENKSPFEESVAEREAGTRIFVRGTGDAGLAERRGGKEIHARDYHFDPETGFGKVIETLGSILDSRYTPGAALMLEDAAMQGIPYRMEIGAQAHRIAQLEGLEGMEFERRRKFLDDNPTKEMIAAAEDHAVLITLNKQLGLFGQWVQAGVGIIPGGKLMLPFVRWSGNAIKWSNQRTPVLNLVSISNWQDISAGGHRQNRAIARFAVGNAVGAAIAYEVWQGNLTGGGGSSREDRMLKPYQECPPYSIKSGDECITNYTRSMGQAGQMIAAVVDYLKLANDIPDQGTMELWAAHGEGIAIALGEMFSQQPNMQQVANALEVMKDPQRSSGKELIGFARSLVPTGVRQLTREIDGGLVREVRSIGDAIKSGLPFYVNDVEIHRNPVTGEAIKYPEGVGPDIASPIFFTKMQTSPVFKEIVENKAQLPPLPWHVGGTDPGTEGARVTEPTGKEGEPLRADERDFWITQMTQRPGPGGLNLHQYMEQMIDTQRYKNQSKSTKAYMLREAYNIYKAAGFAALINPEIGSTTLKDRIINRMREQISYKVPVTDPRSRQYVAP